jgi:peptidoglycan hydrolase CwlO-like protein
MRRFTALVLLLALGGLVSCQGAPQKERVTEEEREEALQEMDRSESERAQLDAELESLKEKIKQVEQELAEEKALTEKSHANAESLQSQLSVLEKERKECGALLTSPKEQKNK